MSKPGLNLLVTLDVLLAESSVARAAHRLRLSPSAMSWAPAQLRETTGDPLLALALGRASDLIAGVPERHTGNLRRNA